MLWPWIPSCALWVYIEPSRNCVLCVSLHSYKAHELFVLPIWWNLTSTPTEGCDGVHKNIASVSDIHGVTLNLEDVPIFGKHKPFFFEKQLACQVFVKLSSSVELWASVAQQNDGLLTNSPMATALHHDGRRGGAIEGFSVSKNDSGLARRLEGGALLF